MFRFTPGASGRVITSDRESQCRKGKVMQSRKKSVLFLLTAVVVSALAIPPAHAQGSRASFNVPFDFVIGQNRMEAGTYRIGTQGNFVATVSGTGKASYALLMAASDAASHDGHPYLRFTRYGKESFLNTIVFSDGASFDLPRSGREKEMMARMTPGEQVDVLSEGTR